MELNCFLQSMPIPQVPLSLKSLASVLLYVTMFLSAFLSPSILAKLCTYLSSPLRSTTSISNTMLLTCLRQSFHAPQVILLCNCFFSSFITWYLALHSAIKVLVTEESCCFLIEVGMVSGTTAWAFTINAPFSSNHCSSVSILMVVVFSFVHVTVSKFYSISVSFSNRSTCSLGTYFSLLSLALHIIFSMP